MQKVKIAPSILSADFSKLGSEIADIEKTGAEYLHIDVMDGHFVPNLTIGPLVIKSLRPHSKMVFDVHLMIENPDLSIPQFVDAGADIITVHTEAVTHLDRTIELIKSYGKKVGVSLVPSTHESVLQYVIHKLDLVLVMSVNPGFGGQEFLPSQLQKIANIRKMNSNIEIQVDGGINNVTAKQAVEHGANVLVSGSYIFSQKGNYKTAVDSLR